VKSDNFEDIPESLKRSSSLKIRGLRKEFGELVAVKDISMTMYNGQIFALLGHNGAGKTTTISMLTGLLQPTAGQAQVFGCDVFEQQDEIRQFTGVCPQHNVLFEFLTVREHLEIYAAFKAVAAD
jgi:ATP-binding cassette, subfamily A (ABC1), member 3